MQKCILLECVWGPVGYAATPAAACTQAACLPCPGAPHCNTGLIWTRKRRRDHKSVLPATAPTPCPLCPRPQGHSAVHLQQHASGCSLFEVSVGNLPARTPCVVQLHYLRLLDSFGSSTLEWAHTATWVPPYQPAPAPSTKPAMADGGDTTVASGLPQGSSAPTAAPAFAEKVSYTLSYEVTVVSDPSAPVKSIQSAEPIDVSVVTPAAGDGAAAGGPGSGGAGGGDASVSGVTATGGAARHVVALAGRRVADPSKDFSLIIELQPPAHR